MPELPEVETVRVQLERALSGRRIVAVEAAEPAMLIGPAPSALVGLLPGRTIVDVRRKGKFLLVMLDGGLYLTMHLGMTGQLLLLSDWRESARGPHDRFVLRLSAPDAHDGTVSSAEVGVAVLGAEASDASGRAWVGACDRRYLDTPIEPPLPPLFLVFRDIRKFGRVELSQDAPAPRTARLGPDAWQGSWDVAYLAARLGSRKVPLKAFLLDQRHLAGIGNIYADEILFAARLSPLRPAGSLSNEETSHLATAIVERLDAGVKARGCSISDFVDTHETPGCFQEVLCAYGRAGERCVRCGGTLVRVIVVGRGTSFCPSCQK